MLDLVAGKYAYATNSFKPNFCNDSLGNATPSFKCTSVAWFGAA